MPLRGLFLKGANNMDIKTLEKSIVVDDGHLLLQKPIEMVKYGKKVMIKPVNWFYEWKDFSYALGIWLHYYYVVCMNSKIPDNLNDLKEFKQNVRSTISHKKAFKMLMKICGYSGFKLRWMKKNFTLDDWIETFMVVFFFNLQVTKKNLSDALKAIGKARLL